MARTKAGAVKAAAKPKAAMAPASHSSKDDFDEEAAMAEINKRLANKDSTEDGKRLIATPQKKKKVPVVSPEHRPLREEPKQDAKSVAPEATSPSKDEDMSMGSHGASSGSGVRRGQPATPQKGSISATSTPIKSPAQKKVKLVSHHAPADVVIEENMEDSQQSAPQVGGGSATQDGSAATGVSSCAVEGSGDHDGECERSLMLRRIDTATTVPEVGLECHLFVQRLIGDHDFSERERLHDEILAWLEKMQSWAGNDDFIFELDIGLQTIVKTLLNNIGNHKTLVKEHETAIASEDAQRQGVEKGYQAMLLKQQAMSAKKGDTLEVIQAKQKALLDWKVAKFDLISVTSTKLRSDMEKTTLEIRSTMDMMIDVAQKIHAGDHDVVMNDTDLQHDELDASIMTELEDLMGSFEPPADTLMQKPTLVLGEISPGECTVPPGLPEPDSQPDTVMGGVVGSDGPPTNGDAQMESPSQSPQQVDATQPPNKEQAEPDASNQPHAPVPPASNAGEIDKGAGKDDALKHIMEMPDGPIKSSLLAMYESSASKEPVASVGPVDAAAEVLKRKDTTQLQVDLHKDDPDAVLQPDGSYLYQGPNGRLETWKQRQQRLAHNQKMVFNRSLKHAPEEVVRAASNRYYNRDVIEVLYQDWLQSGQNWLQSTTYLNMTRSADQKKRGTFLMKPRAWLVSKYGEAVADQVIEQKKLQQRNRKGGEPNYTMANPDVPDSEEHMLFRVFDSLSYEEEEKHSVETGFTAKGDLSEEQTKEFMPVMLRGAKDTFASVASLGQGSAGTGGGGDGAGNQGSLSGQRPPPNRVPKEKKVAGVKKQTQQKITFISSKLTDLKVLQNKVENSPLSESMKAGYLGELNARKDELTNHKLTLEGLYMNPKDEKAIEDDAALKQQFDDAIGKVDQLAPAFASTSKSVKMAIEPPKPTKPKGKGKAKAAAKSAAKEES